MKKALLIIDDDLTRRVYKSALEEEQMEVYATERGEEGLEIFDSQKPDIVIVDMAIDNGQGGKIIELLRKRSQTIPIVAVSVFDFEELRMQVLPLTISDFMAISRTPPKEFAVKVKAILGELKTYQIKVDIESEDLKLWAKDLGETPSFKCQRCFVPLDLLLVKKSPKENLFSVFFICPQCKDIYFGK